MAIQGKKKIEIDKDLILNKIGAYAIYSQYINKLKVGVLMLSPFRKEKTGSFIVQESSNGYYHKDYGAPEYKGGPIDFVQQLFSLSFPEALEKIARDFGLLEKGADVEVKIKEIVQQEKKVKIPDIIQVKSKKMSKEHLEYLSEFHISPNSLSIFPDVKVVAVKEWALNRAKMPLKINEVAFAYVKGKYVKIYRPHAKKSEKFKSTLPYREIMGLSNLENCEFGIITKSAKDAFVIGEHITKNVCCVQGEDFASITQENIDWINENCKTVYLNFDSDPPGKKSSLAITEHTGWKHINVPDKYLEEGIKDFADLGKRYGIEVVIEHFKSKIKEL